MQRSRAKTQLVFLPYFLFVLFTLYSLLFTPLAFANEQQNWGVQPPPEEKIKQNETSEKVFEHEQSDKLYENYGSSDSPGYLNREGIDPSTLETEDKYDYEDDAPYNYDAGGS